LKHCSALVHDLIVYTRRSTPCWTAYGCVPGSQARWTRNLADPGKPVFC
jgi:hypothetical protein